MKTLLITDSDRAGIIPALLQPGHSVFLARRNGPVPYDDYCAIMPNALEGLKENPDLVILDSWDQEPFLKRLQAAKVPVIGYGPFHKRLEKEAHFTSEFLKLVGMRLPTGKEISGHDFYTQVWFSNGEPVGYPTGFTRVEGVPLRVAFMWNYPVREPRVVQQTIKKAYPALRAIKYTGSITVHTIVEESRTYVASITSGFCFMYAFSRIIHNYIGTFLLGLVRKGVEEASYGSHVYMDQALRNTVSLLPKLRGLGFEVPQVNFKEWSTLDVQIPSERVTHGR